MKISILVPILILALSVTAGAAGIPNGYADTPWGTDAHKVIQTYPGGAMGSASGMVLYRQNNPNDVVSMRMFFFKENKLSIVTVRFNPAYVEKTGFDKIIAEHKKKYGEGKLDKSKEPHMITYAWEGKKTRIKLAYAPKRFDMTTVTFEQK